MQVGEVKCAEDVDFERLKQLCRCQESWKQDYNKHNTTVSSKSNDVSDFKVIKVSLDLPVDFDLSFEVPLHGEFPLLLRQHYYSTVSFSLIENVDPAYVPTWEYKIDLVF